MAAAGDPAAAQKCFGAGAGEKLKAGFSPQESPQRASEMTPAASRAIAPQRPTQTTPSADCASASQVPVPYFIRRSAPGRGPFSGFAASTNERRRKFAAISGARPGETGQKGARPHFRGAGDGGSRGKPEGAPAGRVGA